MKTFLLFTGSLLAFCLLIPVPVAAQPLATTDTLTVYKTSDKPTPCPAGTHPENGCVLLTGNAVGTSAWPYLRRIAMLDGAAPNIPAGCVVATSSGTLSGKRGVIHFHAEGYYCPKTDTAFYKYIFNAAETARFGLPERGTMRYVGSNNTETFRASMSSAH